MYFRTVQIASEDLSQFKIGNGILEKGISLLAIGYVRKIDRWDPFS